MTKHFVLPDCQVKPGVPIDHLRAAGNYIVAKKPDVIICLGDFWDMQSLSSYDYGTLLGEGSRYQKDIDAGKRAMEEFLAPIKEYNLQRKKTRHKQYKPHYIFCVGNHEYRIVRIVNQDPRLEGLMTIDHLGLEEFGWAVYDYQEIVVIDGVLYCHNFVNMDSLKKNVIGGSIQNKLNRIGQSFTMGHQQVLQMGMKPLNNGKIIRGLVAGAFYQHDEVYMGPQGNNHYRGCIMKHEVEDGNYCIMELSMDYLLRRWL